MPSCNYDCFNCPYPDCIVNDARAADAEDIDKEVEQLLKTNELGYRRAYYEAHKEEIIARAKERYKNNREKILAQMKDKYHNGGGAEYYKKYYEKNREKKLAQQKARYQANIEKERERGRAYYLKKKKEEQQCQTAT